MVIVKILKRKDASSVLVAIVLAFAVSTFLAALTVDLSSKISGLDSEMQAYRTWQEAYLQPAVMLLLQIVFLEVLAWIVLGLKELMKNSK